MRLGLKVFTEDRDMPATIAVQDRARADVARDEIAYHRVELGRATD